MGTLDLVSYQLSLKQEWAEGGDFVPAYLSV